MKIKNSFNAFSLPMLVFLTCLDLIQKPFEKKQIHTLPQMIGNYRLVKTIENSWEYDTKFLGEYVNDKKQKAFCKMMFFSHKGIEYRKFKYEIEMYAAIHRHMKSSVDMHIPQYILSEEKSDSLLVLLEYVTGVQAQTLSFHKKHDIYIKSIQTLATIGKQFTEAERSQLLSRTGLDYALLYPFLLLMACIRHPRAYMSLLRGGLIFVKNIPPLFHERPLAFSHRDLHFKNILVERNMFWIIDFESAGFTLPLYDICITLWHEWTDIEFTKSVIKYVEKSEKAISNFEIYFQLLMVISATHAMTATNYSDDEIDTIEAYLRYAVTYRKGNYVS